MLGGLFILGEIIGQMGSYVQDETRKTLNKEKAKEEGKDTYLDRQYHQRLVSNDRPVVIKQINGQAWYVDAQTEKPYINLSEREFEKNYKRSIELGKTVVPIGGELENHSSSTEKVRGRRYYDLNTKDIYVIRELCNWNWYIRLSDFKPIRLTDCERNRMEKYPNFAEKNRKDVQDCINKNQNYVKNKMCYSHDIITDEYFDLWGYGD